LITAPYNIYIHLEEGCVWRGVSEFPADAAKLRANVSMRGNWWTLWEAFVTNWKAGALAQSSFLNSALSATLTSWRGVWRGVLHGVPSSRPRSSPRQEWNQLSEAPGRGMIDCLDEVRKPSFVLRTALDADVYSEEIARILCRFRIVVRLPLFGTRDEQRRAHKYWTCNVSRWK
jgi:hypothetical protein